MRVTPLRSLLVFFSLARAAVATSPVSVTTGQAYRGWSDAITLGNGTVEAIVVPSIGRVMQFRFTGETDGPFWANEKLAGSPLPADPWKIAHGSFGGDKTWPAPQSLWNWPPPDIFDAAPLAVRVNADRSVTLTSPVSPRFGLRTVRHIALDPIEPVLRIATTYEKISGTPLTTSIWIITQLRDPVAVFLPIPADTKFPRGLAPQWSAPDGALQRHADLLRLGRDPRKSYKVGNDSAAVVWVGETHLLKIATKRLAGATYPDGGCTAAFYGNADPVPYVELETMSPLQTLRAGESFTATNTYRLARRTRASLEEEARALLTP